MRGLLPWDIQAKVVVDKTAGPGVVELVHDEACGGGLIKWLDSKNGKRVKKCEWSEWKNASEASEKLIEAATADRLKSGDKNKFENKKITEQTYRDNSWTIRAITEIKIAKRLKNG